MKNSRRLILIVGSFALLVVLALGVTYAAFGARVTGLESASVLSMEGGEMWIDVDGGSNIVANTLLPDNDHPWVTKTITLTAKNNISSKEMPYNISIVVDNNTFTTPMLYSLEGTNNSNNGTIITDAELEPFSSTIFLGNGKFTYGNSLTHTYVLTIYYPETGTDQSADMNALFAAHLEVAEGNIFAPKGWSAAPAGSLLAGIRNNNNEPGGEWTIPGRQKSKGRAFMGSLSVDATFQNYYWTYGDGYTISNDKFDLTNPSTCVYNNCYGNLVGKYIISNTADKNSEQSDTLKTTTGLNYIFKVLSADSTELFLETYFYLSRGNYKYWTYGTGAESASNNSTAKFNLTGVNEIDYDEHRSELVGKYLVGSSYDSITVSSVASNTPATPKTTDNIGYFFEVVETTPTYIIYKSAIESSFGKTEDDYGTSYYYRGAVENNYVSFAGMCWRIVRIDGQGNIKLTLYNYNPTSAANPCASSLDARTMAYARYDNTSDGQNGKSVYNSQHNKNTYIGFMYSNNPDSSDYLIAHANDIDSPILANLKSWYDNVFSTAEKNKLADVIWCNDKRVVSDTTYNPLSNNIPLGTGIGEDNTFYQVTQRLNPYDSTNSRYNTNNASPSLKCGTSKTDNLISKFTASTSTDGGWGNGKLDGYKIGLLTADEIVFAGSAYGSGNDIYYLFKNASTADGNYWYWTLSPLSYSDISSTRIRIGMTRGGAITGNYITVKGGLRPAVALKSDVTISSGVGTQASPFVVN